VETKEQDILYRGHLVENSHEETLARAWIAVQRRDPELAAALQITPFPSKLNDLVTRYHSFTGMDGVPIRAVVLKNGRAFFTSTRGGREPPVIRPKAAEDPAQLSQDRVESRPRAEPAPARPAPAAQDGATRWLIPLLRALGLPANADRATIERTYQEVRMSPSPSAARARDAYAAWIAAQDTP
jgi:hypothetical protein